ncbi:MAG: alpha/beta hydrolase [Oscillospiraceae bacterium]|nr:alpha/beta hydrolase [Oscillospiraceae bacterium]
MAREIFDREGISPHLSKGQTDIRLTVLQPDTLQSGWAVLILPGGGYEMTASDREGFPVAEAFCTADHTAAVLEYSVLPDRWPMALLEAAASIALLRQRGAQHIAVCGFSAGGHLAGCIANLWHMPTIAHTLGVLPEKVRPDAAILCYAVVTAQPQLRSRTSFGNLLGSGVAIHDTLSLEKSVRKDNPPTFLWTTASDDSVPAENTLLYATALQRAGVPYEAHIYPHGPHAMALADTRTEGNPAQQDPHVATWFPLCLSWLDTLT